MTDGERLVWAASFARCVGVGNDGCTAARVASRSVLTMRDVSKQRDVSWSTDEREFLDEMVEAP